MACYANLYCKFWPKFHWTNTQKASLFSSEFNQWWKWKQPTASDMWNIQADIGLPSSQPCMKLPQTERIKIDRNRTTRTRSQRYSLQNTPSTLFRSLLSTIRLGDKGEKLSWNLFDIFKALEESENEIDSARSSRKAWLDLDRIKNSLLVKSKMQFHNS